MAEQPEIPSIEQLAKLYQETAENDRFLAGVAEAAAFQVAAAQAAAVEAAALMAFIEPSRPRL